jgi:RHS repeat-associated protein
VSSATYDATNELLNWNGLALTYDANGNMLSDGANAFTWDTRNRLASLNNVSLQYDAFGRRLKNLAGTSFLYDGSNVAQELVGTTAAANLLSGDIDEGFIRSDSSGAFTQLKDALGSTIALADSNGNVQTSYTYDPFGNTSASGPGNANVYQYTGRENEGNGLYYYRARYYDSTVGRFISEDPAGFVGSGPNLYAYVHNNPTNSIDPFGLATLHYWASQFTGPWLDRYGHVSLSLDDGTYISFYPTSFNLLNPNGPIDPIFSGSVDGDSNNEKSLPDINIKLDYLDEAAIKAWWNNYKKSNPKFRGLSNNCSTVVSNAFDSGGGRSKHGITLDFVIWSPDAVLEYAKQLQIVGPGKYAPPPEYGPQVIK